MNIPAHGHPSLSQEQITLLAECIATTDGITVSKALRQIESFMVCDLHSATTTFLSQVSRPDASRRGDTDADDDAMMQQLAAR